jgi:hypothetical protein
MNKPKDVKSIERPPIRPERSLNGRVAPEPEPTRKPTGPVIYTIQKGADVWPGRK